MSHPSDLETGSTVPCLWSPSDSEVGREILRRRLALFTRVLLAVPVSLYLLDRLQGPSSSRTGWLWWIDPSGASPLPPLAASLVLAAMGWLTSWRSSSYARLRGLDACGTLFACAFAALPGISAGTGSTNHQALLAAVSILVARALLVPSRAYETLSIGAAASVPGVVLAALAEPLDLSQCLGYVVAVVLSTFASKLLYELRCEVTEARRLGQYTLEEKIGAGGMGEVYRARHAMLRRPTAVKLLRPDLAGERSIARFEREVQLTSRLTHPNTVSIYDYGRTPDGVFYYAMEHLPGITLEDLVRQDGPQPAGRVIHILKQVCGSLSEAHGIGLIHRDIKGANVILCERGGLHDVVKVVDFGLVKDIGNLSQTTASVPKAILGTIHYLSPEAIQTPDALDPRSDIYSLGALAYHLLAGRQVFEGKTFVEVCIHHVQTPPVPPSARGSFPVPADLERLVLSCLEKEPARRPRSAQDLIHALEACEDASAWSEDLAQAWWKDFERLRRNESSVAEPTRASENRASRQAETAFEPIRRS
ncbi:MAG: serine/threonine protein kinase [Planctomycetes bacterium]|nr:serine/threonine protein kinase [Planctomycetota bacterium]